MKFTTQNTLADIVKSDFRAARVFENYNLDFCCKGNRPLSDACSDKKLNADTVLLEVNSVLNDTPLDKSQDDWAIDELANHILNTHHVYTKEMLPIIFAHSQKVSEVHGKNRPEVVEIAEIFSRVHDELNSHMMKEEKMLFPFILSMAEAEKNNTHSAPPPFGSVSGPISVMEREHVEAGDGFFRIRELSNNFSAPEDACSTYVVLYQELNEFENDLHRHIHLENNILFPKAIELEKKLLV